MSHQWEARYCSKCQHLVDCSIWRAQLVVHTLVAEISVPDCRHRRERAVCSLQPFGLSDPLR